MFQTLADVNDFFKNGISRWAGLNPCLKKNTGFLMDNKIWLLPMFFCSVGAGAVFFLDRDEIRIIE